MSLSKSFQILVPLYANVRWPAAVLYLANKAVYSTVIKHDGNVENTSRKRVFFKFLAKSNVRSVLSQCNTRIRLLHLLDDTEVTSRVLSIL